ncbi:MAG: undecaprenyldiphospho-muramoylpentapeptide beta-N-acetylglucosaminyltransferase [Clostridiales bacterium]|jgi:UDP-N-acetylglucosamine--N-acetylmuramyl-(pentapeptide) pyrophosphoryl-undecaprenol N-acetylglucosamine transferase|nr:undecaprenyldiphospho-muramoylpentapeptide beta-N-acetylglucosaminyltransferase [Clostridiales bacterium]
MDKTADKIVFTGGGTAGHVVPCIAVMELLRKEGYGVEYIGSFAGIERELVGAFGAPYHSVATGKVRRYISKDNLTDIFRVFKGVADAADILRNISPAAVFSKGGYVSVPVVIAAKLLHIPVILHESDMTLGLANRVCAPLSSAVCVTFQATLKRVKNGVFTGAPLRRELKYGVRSKGLALCGFDEKKPVLLVMGGSLGSARINSMLYEALSEILINFQVIHIYGKGGAPPVAEPPPGYAPFEYVGGELPHLLAAADMAVSRAGSNSVCELLFLKKPMLLIPLGKNVSRGDQILNAELFKSQGFAEVIYDELLTPKALVSGIYGVYGRLGEYLSAIEPHSGQNGVARLAEVIKNVAQNGKYVKTAGSPPKRVYRV